jgi:3-oxoacyl-[acyl-carrier-protein] synthase II
MTGADEQVVITGAGVVAPPGTGLDGFWKGLTADRSFAAELPTGVAGYRTLACAVTDESWLEGFRHSEKRRLDRSGLLGLSALSVAATDGGLDRLGLSPERVGLVVGTGYTGVTTMTEQWEIYRRSGPQRMSPFAVASTMTSSVAAFGSIRLGIQGHVMTVSSACASGAQAVLEGARLLRDGSADAVLAGGVEAPLEPVAMAGFHRMDALSRRYDDPTAASRPFDVDRDGFVLGEGAGFVLLTTRRRAREAGLAVMAELAGWGLTCDAQHISAPDPDARAAADSMESALAMAEVAPEEIGHLNAHGTSTRLNDVAEAVAYRRVFGSSPPPVTSLKGAMGHLMGAAGVVELIGSLLTFEHGALPPTVNCARVDPEVGLDVVTHVRPHVPRPFLSASFAFGGVNVALVVKPA